MQLKAILFDMDDTLIDWSKNETTWEEAARLHMGGIFDYVCDHIMPLEDREVFIKRSWEHTMASWDSARDTMRAPHIGRTVVEVLEELGVPPERIIMDEILESYGWGPLPGVTVFDDALEVLPELKKHGIKIGLVTNAAQPIRFRERELKAFGLIDFIDLECRITAADAGYLKPHPQIFNEALDCLGTAPDETVFVGDSVPADIAGAQGVGMKAVLRRLEHRYEDQVRVMTDEVRPDAEIDTLHDLYEILDDWYPGWRKDQ